MPKYKYKFCDGTESVVEVSDEHYVLLLALDKQEKQNNRSQGRRNVPLNTPTEKEQRQGRRNVPLNTPTEKEQRQGRR